MTFAQDWFRFERVMVAARCVGAASRLVDEMTAFAGERMVGGQRLGDYQLVTAMLADSAAELFAARGRALRDRARDRRRRGPQGAPRPRLDDQAALLGDGRPHRRPRGAGLRRPRLHARERRRADVPRAAGRADLGGRLGDPAGHRRAAAAQTRDLPRSSATPSPNSHCERDRDGTKRDQAGSRGGGGGVVDGGRRGVLGRGLRPAERRRPALG